MNLPRTISRQAPLLCAALCTVAFSASSGAEDEPVGAVQECLQQRNIKRTKILNDRSILFVDYGGRQYLNQLQDQCLGLRRNSLLNYPIVNGKYCAGNSFAVLSQVDLYTYVPISVCQLGLFAPVTDDEVAQLLVMTDPKSSRAPRRSERDMVETERVELPPAVQPPAEAAPETAPVAP